MKYHGLASQGLLRESAAESAADTPHDHGDCYYWAAVLRSVWAYETYLRVYRDVITPARVAELMILRRDMPRSLASCVDDVVGTLRMVRNERSDETERRAGLPAVDYP